MLPYYVPKKQADATVAAQFWLTKGVPAVTASLGAPHGGGGARGGTRRERLRPGPGEHRPWESSGVKSPLSACLSNSHAAFSAAASNDSQSAPAKAKRGRPRKQGEECCHESEETQTRCSSIEFFYKVASGSHNAFAVNARRQCSGDFFFLCVLKIFLLPFSPGCRNGGIQVTREQIATGKWSIFPPSRQMAKSNKEKHGSSSD